MMKKVQISKKKAGIAAGIVGALVGIGAGVVAVVKRKKAVKK